MNILVTGGAGYIGSHVSLNLLKYALWYFSPLLSFQKDIGMDGKGDLQTSSPFIFRID